MEGHHHAMTTAITVPRGSEEYVKARVVADVTLDVTVGVEISLSTGNPAAHVWLPAVWTGTESTTRIARTSSAVEFDETYPDKTYSVYVRLTDSPEAPILRAGTLTIN